MNDQVRGKALLAGLGAFGSDFSRWPQDRAFSAREAVLRDRDFRQAWERERDFDRALAAERNELDQLIGRSGAAERVRRGTLARLPGPLAGLGWHRIAAAVLVAGMLGGAMDMFLAEEAGETAELVLLDPLYGLTETDIQ